MNSIVYKVRFQERAKRYEAWGLLLLAIAVALWVWFAVLLLLPYESEGGAECESRLLTNAPTANSGSSDRTPCSAERDWPELLGVLALSVPVSVAGAALFTSGMTSLRVGEFAAEMSRMNSTGDQPDN